MTMLEAAAERHGWQIERARTWRQRTCGLLGRRGLSSRRGLWLPVRSVHTVGMRFPIDLVWLAGDATVRRVDLGVGPGRVRTCVGASGGVVEVAAGRGPALAASLEAAGRGEPVPLAAAGDQPMSSSS